MSKSNNESYFILYTHCIPVKGLNNSLIYDVQRRDFYEIDNLAYELLSLCSKYRIGEIKKNYNFEQDEGIEMYIDFFVNNELGFINKSNQFFSKLNMHWESSAIIDTTIIEIDDKLEYNIDTLINTLNELGCSNLQIRCLKSFKHEKEKLIYILDYIKHKSIIKGVELYLPSSINLPIENIVTKYKVIAKVIIYNSETNEIVYNENRSINSRIQLIKASLDDLECSTKNIFFLHQDTFIEAQKHNIGLNRKISITSKGLVKNYITHSKDFGHIDKLDLKELVITEDFTFQWYIENDRIEVCKDCKFRYMCINNNEITWQDNIYRRSEYCNYNPYEDCFNKSSI